MVDCDVKTSAHMHSKGCIVHRYVCVFYCALTLYRPRMRVIACTRATAINPRYRVVLASLAVARKRYRFLCDRRPACVQRSYQDEELPSEELILTCHAYATRNSAKKNG